MKISFWIPAVCLYVVSVVFSTSVQVGTVLFTTTDLVKKCWTESDKSLLQARSIMQDVLPDPDCIDFSNPEAVSILLDYFQSCYHVVAMSTYGKVQNLMYLALSDALGGYLRAYVLPFTRKAYYAGQVRYSDAKKLFQLYDDIRVFLKTNGVGWRKPQKPCHKILRVKPLAITGGSLEACKELYVIEKKGKFHCINSNSNLQAEESRKKAKARLKGPRVGFPESPEKFINPPKVKPLEGRRRNNRRERRRGSRFEENNETLSFFHFINGSEDSERFFRNLSRSRSRDRLESPESGEHGDERQLTEDCTDLLNHPYTGGADVRLRRVVVPLPILDDCRSPHSIAVPFRKNPLRNLRSACSAFVLEYYYMAVVKCFIAKGNTRSDIKNFNGQFHSWIVTQVVPHLCDEQWYPGFGGVLRVLQTIKRFGVDTPGGEPVMHDIAFMFNEGAEFEVERNGPDERGSPKVRNVEERGESEIPDEDIMTDEGGVPLTEGEFNSERHAILVILIISIIWLFIFCAFGFFCQATRGHKHSVHPQQHPICTQQPQHSMYPQQQMYPQQPQHPMYPQQPMHPHFAQQPQQYTCRGTPADDDNNIKLQFLVKFFKKDENAKPRPTCCFNAVGQNQLMRRTSPREEYRMFPMDWKDEGNRGDRNCFTYFTSLFSSFLPTEPYLASFERKEKQTRQIQSQGQGDQVQMLWKKPSQVHFGKPSRREGREPKSKKTRYASTLSGSPTGSRRTTTCSACLDEETKGYTTEKHSTTCYCSEECRLWPTTTTTTSSTHVEEKLSSATLEFFEDVIAKHKAKKGSLLTSTAESESEFCTTSETDY